MHGKEVEIVLDAEDGAYILCRNSRGSGHGDANECTCTTTHKVM